MIFLWRFWLLVGAFVTLTSCATAGGPAPKIVVQRVEVPVAVACAAPLPPEPAYADTGPALKAAPDLFEQVKLLLAGRLQRIAYAGELKASRAGCD